MAYYAFGQQQGADNHTGHEYVNSLYDSVCCIVRFTMLLMFIFICYSCFKIIHNNLSIAIITSFTNYIIINYIFFFINCIFYKFFFKCQVNLCDSLLQQQKTQQGERPRKKKQSQRVSWESSKHLVFV